MSCFHAGPLIRREDEYRAQDLVSRRKIFSRLVAFARACPIFYRVFSVDKRFFSNPTAMQAELARQMRDYLNSQRTWLSAFDVVKVYYDNGQAQVKAILKEAFRHSNVTFPAQVTPERYRLFQVADLICTVELTRLKLDVGLSFTRSEDVFSVASELSRRRFSGRFHVCANSVVCGAPRTSRPSVRRVCPSPPLPSCRDFWYNSPRNKLGGVCPRIARRMFPPVNGRSI